MQVEVDTSAPTVAKVTLSVPADEFETKVKSELRQASRNVTMKGFRPGKVPMGVLEKRFGESVRADVKERFVQEAYGKAIEENSLKPMAHPRLTPEALELNDDGSLAVEFEVPLRPTFDLPDYKGLSVESELEPVMDDQVEATLEDLRNQQATPEAAGDDGMTENGFVIADISFQHDGNEVFERSGMRLNTNSVPPGIDEETFANGLIGAKDGDVIKFDMTLPEFIEDEAARGQAGQCVVNVTNSMKLIPATDEELISIVDGGNEDRTIASVDDLKDFIRERLAEAAQQREDDRVEGVLLDKVLDATPIEVPATMVEQQAEGRLAQLEQQLRQAGNTDEQVEAAKEEQRESAKADSAKGLKALLVVEAIGDAEELLVNHDDIAAELGKIAERNQTSVEEVQEYYSQNNLGQQLAIEILEKKVRRFLRENADIKSPE